MATSPIWNEARNGRVPPPVLAKASAQGSVGDPLPAAVTGLLERLEESVAGVVAVLIDSGNEHSRGRAENVLATALSTLRGPTAGSADPPLFRLEGEYWRVIYRRKEVRLKKTRGMSYLAELLWHPGREIHSSELMRVARGDAAGDGNAAALGIDTVSSNLGDVGPLVDERARREYRDRVVALREELAEAETNHDQGRIDRVRAELEAIANQLVVTGRGRRWASHNERARLAVTKGIKAALRKIQVVHPELGRHLEATIRRGYFCVYVPDPSHAEEWQR